ncbi:unnamed protein product, partial [Ectocarpus sp. 12 AP-2014]
SQENGGGSFTVGTLIQMFKGGLSCAASCQPVACLRTAVPVYAGTTLNCHDSGGHPKLASSHGLLRTHTGPASPASRKTPVCSASSPFTLIITMPDWCVRN